MTDVAILALLIGLLAASSVVPIWFGRRVRVPSRSQTVVEVPYRKWVGRFLKAVVPASFMVAALAMVIILARLGASLGGVGDGGLGALGGALLGMLAGGLMGLPLVAMAWAWRRVMGAGVRATSEGVFAFGRFLPWERLEIEEDRQGLVLIDRTAKLFRKHPMPRRTFLLDEDLVDELERLASTASPDATS